MIFDSSKDKQLLHRYLLNKKAAHAISELIGIASTLLYDGQISDKEIEFLDVWLIQNQEYQNEWPISEFYALFKKVMEDNIVTPDERKELLEFFSHISISNAFSPTVDGIYTTDPKIIFQNKRFLFTGELQWGERDKVRERIIMHGGSVSTSNSFTNDIDYLIVGEKGSEDWSNGRFGTKIKTALERMRSHKTKAIIIRERDFIHAIIK